MRFRNHRNSAFRSAYDRGQMDALQGRERTSPYGDRRSDRGGVTFSRAFDRAWTEGYDAGKRKVKKRK